MNKSMLVLFIATLWITKVTAQDAPVNDIPHVPNRRDMGFKGPVIQVKEYVTENEEQAVLREALEFDTAGYLTMRRQNIPMKKDGNALSATRYGYSNGRPVYEVRYVNARMQDSAVLLYNPKGLLLKRHVYDSGKKPLRRYRYSYNGRLQPISIREKDGSNTLLSMIRYRYDSLNTLRERILYDADLRQVYGEVFLCKKDDGKRTLMNFRYDKPDTCTGMVSTTFDTAGNVLERTVADADRRVTEYRRCNYDHANRITRDEIYTDVKHLWKYEYLADHRGNWKEKRIYRDDTLRSLVLREITYSGEQKQQRKKLQ